MGGGNEHPHEDVLDLIVDVDHSGCERTNDEMHASPTSSIEAVVDVCLAVLDVYEHRSRRLSLRFDRLLKPTLGLEPTLFSTLFRRASTLEHGASPRLKRQQSERLSMSISSDRQKEVAPEVAIGADPCSGQRAGSSELRRVMDDGVRGDADPRDRRPP